jgi:hypothetical protein
VVSQKIWDSVLLIMILLISILLTASLLQWLTGGQFPLVFSNLAQKLLNIISVSKTHYAPTSTIPRAVGRVWVEKK